MITKLLLNYIVCLKQKKQKSVGFVKMFYRTWKVPVIKCNKTCTNVYLVECSYHRKSPADKRNFANEIDFDPEYLLANSGWVD